MEDPFLNYFALGLLFFVIIVLVYGIIAIHDIPARIAHARHHPHADAIHAAGWISLFMLHVLWPFLWIWAMMYQPDRGWGFAHKSDEPASPKEAVAELEQLRQQVAEIQARLAKDRADQSNKAPVVPAIDSPRLSASAAEESPTPHEAVAAESRGDARPKRGVGGH